ncbi:sortase [Subtercola sp. PAMC28395]|uniref:sortase n=1 Tax=Subtercola sp. PAMC28395 TaxID=2846775 RepID=UPI00209B24CF|nr:sortase [Subtercola sp. PAMC28395]
MTATIEAPPGGTLAGPPSLRPPKPPKPPKVPKAARPPRPPRRPPASAMPVIPLGPAQTILRGVLLLVAVMLFAFAANLMILSHVQHAVAQQQQSNELRVELAAGTTPVSEATFDDKLVADGAPLGIIDIPSIGVHEVISEGTSADILKNGPGHRRDSVLPGQAGISTVMGRAAAYGGPFSRIQELAPGDRFTVLTGQGTQTFSVIGVRYAGDPVPTFQGGTSRLTMITARGPAYIPNAIAYVDAALASEVQPAGKRQTTYLALPATQQAMATDPSTVWALVFALQFLLAVEIAAVWAYRKIGPQKTWVVFLPLSVLAALYVANQMTLLLPNLL